MGRKDRLRREKQARQRKVENAATVAATTAQATPAVATTGTIHDAMFPKSEFYVQAGQENNFDDLSIILFRGATEYGCVHSMNEIGKMHTQSHLNGSEIHFGQPWLLEGAIRGSVYCGCNLSYNYREAKPGSPDALVSYWIKMMNRYREWSGTFDTAKAESGRNILKGHINKSCAICYKEDTETLTLRQCMGCSTYCYCSEECQTIHYNEQNHGGECNQLKILNKYHKPYAKEIRKAAIRGESHPALEKLRHKLGLTRPIEEYDELRHATNIYEGRPINPYEFRIARTDGTVWIGSTPMNPLGPSATTAIVSTEGDQSSLL